MNGTQQRDGNGATLYAGIIAPHYPVASKR
jgi:hypothetical protein